MKKETDGLRNKARHAENGKEGKIMDMKKFTEKSSEALVNAQRVSTEYGNADINQLHLLFSLLSDKEGLIAHAVVACGGKRFRASRKNAYGNFAASQSIGRRKIRIPAR